MSKKKPVEIYQLKIVLNEIEPPIFRILQIKGNANLGKLHDYIQGIMGWTNSHLHEFDINAKRYRSEDQMDYEGELGVFNERRYRLNKLVKQGDSFTYLYDFGDDWEHTITVEKIMPPAEGVYYPICTYGERACPPEDSGGSMGYEDFLEVLNNPEHEEYEHFIEWSGGDFDPSEFDIKETNKILDNIKSNIREPR